MHLGGAAHRPGGGIVVAGLAVVVGTCWALVGGWSGLRFWGFMDAPPCIDDGTCTWDSLGRQQTGAVEALAPAALLVVAGFAVAVVVLRRSRPPSARLDPPPAGRPGTLAAGVAGTTLAVEVVAAFPLLLTVFLGLSLGMAALGAVGVLLVGVLVRVLTRTLDLRDALPVALAAAAAAGVGGGAVVLVGLATTYTASLLLLVLPPVLAGAAASLTVRALTTGSAPPPPSRDRV